jgi:TRAP-type uncharacterized transport system fused permease subunit
MSVYHLTIAFIGAPQQLFFRSTHLLFALTLVFLLYPQAPRRRRRPHRAPARGPKTSWMDWLFIAGSFVTIGSSGTATSTC